MFIDTNAPILPGSKWSKSTPGGIRTLEVIERPTLSRAAKVRIVRNDTHPHRKGRTTRITAAKLRADYKAVA